MKKLRPSKRRMTTVTVISVVASSLLAFSLWAVVRCNIAIAAAIAIGLSAVIVLGIYLVTDKGISFDEEKFVVKGGKEYYFYEIEEVRVKTSEFDFRLYKAIVVYGEEVCTFNDRYDNSKELLLFSKS